MKRRIGILRGQPIIEGDINLKTGNEIHISDLRGGSGSGSGESSTIEYLDISNFNSVNGSGIGIEGISTKCHVDGDKNYFIVRSADLASIGGAPFNLVAVSYDMDAWYDSESNIKIKDYLIDNLGYTQEELDAIPRITKEEFYNLEA